jgi:hypothetical protein
MANRKKQHLYSTSLNEYTYRVLNSITPDQKENLTIDELKIFESDYTLQKFSKESTIDYRGYLMAKMGVSWTLQFYRDHEDVEMLEFLTKDQYEYPFKRMDITESTSGHDVCVISSREAMIYSHMLSQNCTTQVYAISEFSKRMAQKMKDVKILTNWDSEVVDVTEGHETFNDILLEQLNSLSYAQQILGLDEADLRILCALFKKRNSAIKMNQVAELTKSKGRKMYFRKNMMGLLERKLVLCDVKDLKKVWANSVYFMITEGGIDKVMKYQKFVYRNTFGD